MADEPLEKKPGRSRLVTALVTVALLLFAAVPLSFIAYAALGPVVGAIGVLGTLILIQYPVMRLVMRRNVKDG